jgi:O-antigen/teichoic acid export membrane protein
VSKLRLLGTNSAIYAGTSLLQKGSAFLLLPLYTLYLDPQAYGVLAIVTAVNGLLSIVFTLGLTGAVTRFYFEFQDQPTQLAEFWGSILVCVLLLSTAVGGALLMFGETLLRPIIGEVPFWPYVALGVMAVFFQPFFTTFLSVLQTRNQATRYALVSLAHFALTTLLTIVLVVMLHQGVLGALQATLAAAVVFFGISLWLLRKDITPCLNWRHLRPAFSYGLPQVPHAAASQVTATTDRLILNAQVGTATAGVYAVGAMMALLVEVAAQSVNRAYMPLSMAALKGGTPAELAQLRALGALVVAGFCLLGAGIGLFARELVWLFASPAFAPAASVVPVLAFGGVASAIYYLLVNVLFFDRGAIRYLPLGTLTAAGLNVGLALLLVPRFGLLGAAWATLLAQALATVLIAVIGSRFDPVRWDHGRYALAFGGSLALTLGLGSFELGGNGVDIAARVVALGLLGVLLGAVLWNRPLILAEALMRLLSRQPAAAAALLAGAHRTQA